MSAQSKSRWMFIGVVALFAFCRRVTGLPATTIAFPHSSLLPPRGPFAGLLRFGGWQPTNTRNYGELLQPPQALASGVFHLLDGQPYEWQPTKRRWHLVLLPSSTCQNQCAVKADVMRRVWISEGRLADKLDVLWMGNWPESVERFEGLREVRLAAAINHQDLLVPRVAEQMTAALVDHNGFLVMRYPLDFDPNGVRKDLGRLVK